MCHATIISSATEFSIQKSFVVHHLPQKIFCRAKARSFEWPWISRLLWERTWKQSWSREVSFQDKGISSYWVFRKFRFKGFERKPFALPSLEKGERSVFIRHRRIFRTGVARECSMLESHWADRWLVLHQSAPRVKRGAVLAQEAEEGLAWSSRTW